MRAAGVACAVLLVALTGGCGGGAEPTSATAPTTSTRAVSTPQPPGTPEPAPTGARARLTADQARAALPEPAALPAFWKGASWRPLAKEPLSVTLHQDAAASARFAADVCRGLFDDRTGVDQLGPATVHESLDLQAPDERTLLTVEVFSYPVLVTSRVFSSVALRADGCPTSTVDWPNGDREAMTYVATPGLVAEGAWILAELAEGEADDGSTWQYGLVLMAVRSGHNVVVVAVQDWADRVDPALVEDVATGVLAALDRAGGATP